MCRVSLESANCVSIDFYLHHFQIIYRFYRLFVLLTADHGFFFIFLKIHFQATCENDRLRLELENSQMQNESLDETQVKFT